MITFSHRRSVTRRIDDCMMCVHLQCLVSVCVCAWPHSVHSLRPMLELEPKPLAHIMQMHANKLDKSADYRSALSTKVKCKQKQNVNILVILYSVCNVCCAAFSLSFIISISFHRVL